MPVVDLRCFAAGKKRCARPYVECVEVGCHVGRIGAREGVPSADGDLPRICRFQAVSGVVCERKCLVEYNFLSRLPKIFGTKYCKKWVKISRRRALASYKVHTEEE